MVHYTWDTTEHTHIWYDIGSNRKLDHFMSGQSMATNPEQYTL